MEIQNWNEYITSQDHVDINPFAPTWPFRLMIIGGSGSGKTNMLTSLLMNYLYFENLYILAKDIEEPLYVFLREFFLQHNKESKPISFIISNRLEDLPATDDLDKRKQTLVIFDDFVIDKNQQPMEEYFIRGRKKNASMVYITQSYFLVPKTIRLNTTYFAIYKIPNNKEIRAIADAHSTRVPYSDFKRIYNEATKDPYNFLVIDTLTQDLPFHLRKNWDGLLAEDI